jgi:hypothetical protein
LLDEADPVALEDAAVLEMGVTAAADAPADEVEIVLACVGELSDLIEDETRTS